MNNVRATLQIVTDPTILSEQFNFWFETIVESAKNKGDYYELRTGEVRFRKLQPTGDRLRNEFWVGKSVSTAVQINQPPSSDLGTGLSALGIDEGGIHYIMRQGRLQKNKISDGVGSEEFQRLTGLTPTRMTLKGKPTKSEWFTVTALQAGTPKDICDATAQFVVRCEAVRKAKIDARKAELNTSLVYGRTRCAAEAEFGEMQPNDEELAWAEGDIRIAQHLRAERVRNSRAASQKKQAVIREHGKLICDRCNCDYHDTFGKSVVASVFEIHHNIPLAEMEKGHITKLADLQCLCANCHRATHHEMTLRTQVQKKK